MLFKPDWIAQVVLLHKPVSEVAAGEYFLLPHFCDPLAVSNTDSPQFHTPERPSLPPLSDFTMKQYRLRDVMRSEKENVHEEETAEEAIEQLERKTPTKQDVQTSSNSGISIVFPLKGDKYGKTMHVGSIWYI